MCIEATLSNEEAAMDKLKMKVKKFLQWCRDDDVETKKGGVMATEEEAKSIRI